MMIDRLRDESGWGVAMRVWSKRGWAQIILGACWPLRTSKAVKKCSSSRVWDQRGRVGLNALPVELEQRGWAGTQYSNYSHAAAPLTSLCLRMIFLKSSSGGQSLTLSMSPSAGRVGSVDEGAPVVERPGVSGNEQVGVLAIGAARWLRWMALKHARAHALCVQRCTSRAAPVSSAKRC